MGFEAVGAEVLPELFGGATEAFAGNTALDLSALGGGAAVGDAAGTGLVGSGTAAGTATLTGGESGLTPVGPSGISNFLNPGTALNTAGNLLGGGANTSSIGGSNPLSLLQSLFGTQSGSLLSGLFNTGSGAYGLSQAQQLSDLAAKLRTESDPFSPYRAGYAQQLQQLMANPSSVANTPGYQFGMDQGTQALMRSSAAGGYTGSGNEGIALTKFGQDYASQQYMAQIAQLAGLSGANINPASAANLQFQGATAGLNLQGNALNTLGYGASQIGNAVGGSGSPNVIRV